MVVNRQDFWFLVDLSQFQWLIFGWKALNRCVGQSLFGDLSVKLSLFVNFRPEMDNDQYVFYSAYFKYDQPEIFRKKTNKARPLSKSFFYSAN